MARDRMAEEMSTIFHVALADELHWANDHYAARSLTTEGFIHASYREKVLESARLYFPANADLRILEIDPTGLDVRVVETPRGPMPHIHGAIPRASVVRIVRPEEL